MKTTILILALFCFSFSLESFTPSEETSLKLSAKIETVTIHHYLGNGQFFEMEIPIEALNGHIMHGDHETGGVCEPPFCD